MQTWMVRAGRDSAFSDSMVSYDSGRRQSLPGTLTGKASWRAEDEDVPIRREVLAFR